MKLKKIESELAKGRETLAAYKIAMKNAPKKTFNKDVFEMMQEIYRLQELRTDKLKKKLLKLKSCK